MWPELSTLVWVSFSMLLASTIYICSSWEWNRLNNDLFLFLFYSKDEQNCTQSVRHVYGFMLTWLPYVANSGAGWVAPVNQPVQFCRIVGNILYSAVFAVFAERARSASRFGKTGGAKCEMCCCRNWFAATDKQQHRRMAKWRGCVSRPILYLFCGDKRLKKKWNARSARGSERLLAKSTPVDGGSMKATATSSASTDQHVVNGWIGGRGREKSINNIFQFGRYLYLFLQACESCKQTATRKSKTWEHKPSSADKFSACAHAVYAWMIQTVPFRRRT